MEGGLAPVARISEVLIVNEPTELKQNRQWRLAVWALRVGYLALATAGIGLVLVATGSTRWVLATGVIIWIFAAVVTVTGVVRARHDLPAPRPGYLSMRFMLIRDTVHAGSASGRNRSATR